MAAEGAKQLLIRYDSIIDQALIADDCCLGFLSTVYYSCNREPPDYLCKQMFPFIYIYRISGVLPK